MSPRPAARQEPASLPQHRGGPTPYWTDQQLLDQLRQAARAVGSPLSIARYDAYRRTLDGKPLASPATLVFRFGSWNEAVRQAGLPTAADPWDALPLDPQDLRWLQQAAQELQAAGPLRRAEYTRWAREHREAPPAAELVRRYGNWVAVATQAAGVSPWRRLRDEDALAWVARCAQALGKPPSLAEYSRWASQHTGAPATITLRTRFRGWRRVLQLAGVAPDQQGLA